MTNGQKAIVTVGAFIITFVTVCIFWEDDIKFLITSKAVERKYGNANENVYFVDDNFSFVDNYEDTEVNSKQDIINSIYYLLNSGVSYSERYCAKDYTTCQEDFDSISSDVELLSNLNNFVHPYNSFDKINFDFGNNKIGIKINRIYSSDDIEKINSVVDEIIDNNITYNMSTNDKIKVIHDYIINNTDYDTEYDTTKTDNKYRSNTAYGVLVDGKGICSGYSDAMAIFLAKLNIINYKISNNDHIWNLVYLDGEWLHLDTTWDDPISDKNITRDNYFLISTNNLNLLDDNEHSFNSNIFSEAKKTSIK